MKQYYYHFKGEQTGPANIQEITSLIKEGIINHNTLIWFNGLVQWKDAGQVEELKNLFSSPPPLPLVESTKKAKPTNELTKKETSKSSLGKKATSYLKDLVLRGIFLFIVISVLSTVVFIIGNIINNRSIQNNIQNRPQSFLKIEGIDYKIKLLKNDYVEGTVSNISDETTYGQVVLKLEWLDKNEAVISRTSHDLTEIVRPLGTKKFKIPTNSPLKGKTYRVSVNSARAIN